MNEKTDRKEYIKKWQQNNKEKTRENAKRYYYKNIDKIKDKRQSNEYKEKYREYKREWARENRKKQKEIINNLQSKINKINQYIKEAKESDSCTILPSGKISDVGYCLDALEDIEDILREDK